MTIYYCTLSAFRFCVKVMKDTVKVSFKFLQVSSVKVCVSVVKILLTKNGENKPHLRAMNFILIKKLH